MKCLQSLRPQRGRAAGFLSDLRAVACCVLFLFTLFAAVPLRAQNVKLPSRTLSVSSLFSIIEKQTGYLIVYSNVNIDKRQRVSFTGKEAQMSAILRRVLQSDGACF